MGFVTRVVMDPATKCLGKARSMNGQNGERTGDQTGDDAFGGSKRAKRGGRLRAPSHEERAHLLV